MANSTNQMEIREMVDNGIVITNKELHYEAFKHTFSLCSDSELKLGSCETNSIEFTVSDVFQSLIGKRFQVTRTEKLWNGEATAIIGQFTVVSDKRDGDTSKRNIVAYDDMNKILEAGDITSWFINDVIPTDPTQGISLRQVRDRFFSEIVGIEQEVINLPFDTEMLYRERYLDLAAGYFTVSAKEFITALCEINGCFGNIGADGKFQYITLENATAGVYPSLNLYPSTDLFPETPNGMFVSNSMYKSCTYESYMTDRITGIKVIQRRPSYDFIVGAEGNVYTIDKNIFLHGRPRNEINAMIGILLNKAKGLTFKPFEAVCCGSLQVGLGASIRINTKNEIVKSYVLEMVTKGIQVLTHTISASGEQKYREVTTSDYSSGVIDSGGGSEIVGASGSFTTLDGRTVVVENGLIVDIY